MEEIKKRRRVQKKRTTETRFKINDFSWKEAKVALYLLFLIFLVIIIGIILYYGKSPSEEVKTETVIQEVERYLPKTAPPVKVTSTFLRDKDLLDAKAVLENFLSAKISATASPSVIHKSPFLFSSVFNPTPEAFSIKPRKAIEYEDGVRSAIYFLDLPGGAKEIHLYAPPDQEFKVDWMSYFLCGTLPFSTYVKTLPSAPQEVYCYLKVDTYYTPLYPEKDYQSLEIRDYTGEIHLYSYVPRDSYMSDMLADAMLASDLKLEGKPAIRARLSVKSQPEALMPTAEIIDVLATDWTTPMRNLLSH